MMGTFPSNPYIPFSHSRQLATAIWIIDKLALRVGNDKDEDEADTVGCCSLRVEHLSFKDPYWLTMDFLAKDSMRYHQEIRVGLSRKDGSVCMKNHIHIIISF